jgi:hypothetical protein
MRVRLVCVVVNIRHVQLLNFQALVVLKKINSDTYFLVLTFANFQVTAFAVHSIMQITQYIRIIGVGIANAMDLSRKSVCLPLSASLFMYEAFLQPPPHLSIGSARLQVCALVCNWNSMIAK